MSTEHAGHGARAIKHGTPDYGLNGHDEEGLRTDVVDTLANLMHYCASATIDFGDALIRAEMHFDAEQLAEQ